MGRSRKTDTSQRCDFQVLAQRDKRGCCRASAVPTELVIAADCCGDLGHQDHRVTRLFDGAGDDELFVCHGSSGALAACSYPHRGLACPIIQDTEDFTMFNAPTVDKKTVPPLTPDKSKQPDEHKQTMLSQPSVTNTLAKLSDLPVELVSQLMAWMMVDELSERSARSLGCVSKQFHAALQEFTQGDWYAKFSYNLKKSQQASDWIRSYLTKLGSRPYLSHPQSPENLMREMPRLSFEPSKSGDTQRGGARLVYLVLDKKSPDAFNADSIKVLQNFGAGAIHIHQDIDSADTLFFVEALLPPHVLLHVHFGYKPDADVPLAKLITQLACGNRQLSFVFDDLYDLSLMPESCKALFEALCKTSNVAHVGMGPMKNPDVVLKEFSNYCNSIRGVQLFSLEASATVEVDVGILKNFIAALQNRVEQGKSPMAVAFGLYSLNIDNPAHRLIGDIKNRKYEPIGLFGECANHSSTLGEVIGSLFQALNKRSFGADEKNTAGIDSDSDVGSDSVIDSSDEEDAHNALHGEKKPAKSKVRVQHQDHQRQQSADVVRTEPRVRNRKRDKCVVS